MTRAALAISLVLFACGCAFRHPVNALRKPILVLYCAERTPDRNHCAVWAPVISAACVTDHSGGCTPGTK